MRSFGKEIEDLVSAYLQAQGLHLIVSNYLCKAGEIDLIMQDNDVMVFIEVRYRKNVDYGDGLISVTKSKQQKIKRAATYYLQEQNLYDKILCRFDVVAVNGERELSWIKDAFWAKW